MDSLYSSYISDKESESDMELTNTDENSSEADANCEPVKMDLSEGSSENEMDRKDSKTNKQSSRSSSNTSDKLDEKHKKHDGNSREKHRSTKNDAEKTKDEEKGQKLDRRDKERRKERDNDRRYHDRNDRKHSRRSKSKNSYRSSKSSRRSKSRSRSHSRKSSRSPRRRSSRSPRSHHRNHQSSSHRHHRHHSPSSYRSNRRSRSRSYDRHAHSRGYEKRGVSRLHALEKMGIELKVPEVSMISGNMLSAAAAGLTKPQTLTPQLALQKTIEEQVEKVKTATGIALPSYYNPIAVNASKYAEQIQKRKLLWGNKDKMVPEEAPAVDTTPQLPANKGTIWQGATFGGDQGSRVTAKFKRLMGMKEIEQDANPDKNTESTPDIIKKQEELFTSMESQYEVARLATHSHRGLGLGFGTFQPR